MGPIGQGLKGPQATHTTRARRQRRGQGGGDGLDGGGARPGGGSVAQPATCSGAGGGCGPRRHAQGLEGGLRRWQRRSRGAAAWRGVPATAEGGGRGVRQSDVQRSWAGPGRAAARCRATRTRPATGGGGSSRGNSCGGRVPAPAVHKTKGKKGRGARVTHHEPVLGVDLSRGWSEKRIDAREAELGLALMATGGRARVFGQLGRGGAQVRGGEGGGGSEEARGARNREKVERRWRISAGGGEPRELARALLEEEEEAG